MKLVDNHKHYEKKNHRKILKKFQEGKLYVCCLFKNYRTRLVRLFAFKSFPAKIKTFSPENLPQVFTIFKREHVEKPK